LLQNTGWGVVVVSQAQEKLNYLTLLQTAIEQKHHCFAVHCESVRVQEVLGKNTIWEGDVEVFELNGHAQAHKCYAWSHRENGMTGNVLNSENMRLITVLGKRPVDSPEMAVKAAIFYDLQPITSHDFLPRPTL
jgi:hypothetical protein